MRPRRAAAVVAFSLVAAACIPVRPPKAGADIATAKTPVPTPSATATPAAPSVPMGVAWRYSMRHFEILPWAPIEWAGPVVKDGVVYAGTARGHALYAIDAHSGSVRWVFHPRARVDSTPAIGGGRVYTSTDKGVVWGVAQESGAEIWHQEIAGLSTSRLLYDVSDGSERVLVPTADNRVHCLDARNGAELWVYRREPPADLTIWGTSTPAKVTIGGADAYVVGFSDGSVVAIKASSGAPLWERRLVNAGRFRDVDGQVGVDGDRIYVTAYSDETYALDRESGRILWSVAPGGATGVAIGSGKIFSGTDRGDLVARDPSDGHELWRWHLPAGVPTTPAAGGGLVFVASSARTLYAINADTGALAWQFSPEFRVSGAWAPPWIDGDRVFLVSNVGTVYAFQPQSASSVFIRTWDSGSHRR